MTSAADVAALGLDTTQLEALIEIMFLAAQADGEFSGDEKKHFAAAVESMTGGKLSGEPLDALLRRVEEDYFSYGREIRLKALRPQLPSDAARKSALEMAVEVVASDGIIRTSERELLLEVAEALDIDRDVAADLVKKHSPA